MLKKISIAVGVIVVLFLVYAATGPDTFRIERTATIQAPPEKIYPYMSDFHKGDLWSPYERKDPAMKRTFSGPENGKGAVYEFDGDPKKTGKGRLEIIEAVPPVKVVLTLDMIEPIKGHNVVEYTLEPKGGGTSVTWAMTGKNTYLGKIVCTFINMDKMVGGDFEAGLANLKSLVEKKQ
jgi:uncharacterized protein YndB with AHSA1/START domain